MVIKLLLNSIIQFIIYYERQFIKQYLLKLKKKLEDKILDQGTKLFYIIRYLGMKKELFLNISSAITILILYLSQ